MVGAEMGLRRAKAVASRRRANRRETGVGKYENMERRTEAGGWTDGERGGIMLYDIPEERVSRTFGCCRGSHQCWVWLNWWRGSVCRVPQRFSAPQEASGNRGSGLASRGGRYRATALRQHDGQGSGNQNVSCV